MSVPPPRRPMNPDEIITQNDIPGYYVSGQFIPETDEAANKLTVEQKGNAKGIARRIVYADGRVQVWLRNPGQDPAQYGTKIQDTTDTEAQKDWDRRVDEANKRAEKESPDTQSPAAQRTAREEAEIARNAALPPEQDPRSETDAQRAARAVETIKAQGAAAAANAKAAEPTITIKPIRQPDGSTKNVQVRIYPDGREEVLPSTVPGEAAPVTKPQPNERGAPVRGGDGKLYYPVRKLDPATNTVVEGYEDEQGKPTGPPPKVEPQRNLQTVVRDGQLYEVVPGVNGAAPTLREIKEQGAATGPVQRAPSMPHIIVGASQDALREAYDGIQAEVDAGRRTAAWGENRRKEVFETAQLTVNEAHLHEQSRQFNQSQAFNVANARMQNQQGVLEFALRSALSINGKIKKGSSAGAELFRGLFNLGMRMQADSGINNIRPGGGRSSIPGAPGRPGTPGQPARAGNPTTRPPMDIGDAKALAAHADQEAANIAAGLESSGAPRERTPTVPGNAPAQPLPVRNGVPVTSTPAAAPPSAPGTTDPGFYRPGMQAPATGDSAYYPAGMQAPDTTDPGFHRTPALTSPMQAPGSGAPLRVRDSYGNEFEVTQQQLDARPGGSKDLTILGPAPAPQAMTLPEPQFAAMEPFHMKAPQIDPMMDPMQQGMGEMPAALTHTQIAATPPWLLPQDRLPDLVRQYGEDAVFGWPGMPREEAVA